MASSWRDILPSVLAERETRAVSEVSADSPDQRVSAEPNCTNCTNCTLPAAIVAGLQRARAMSCPRGIPKATWQRVVDDAVALGDRWAERALGLGWTPLDLFGAVPDPRGDPDADGLAVKLRGRPVLAICSSFATVQDGPSSRSFIYRVNNEGAVLLWQLGKPQ